MSNILVITASVILTAFFLLASSIKILGWQKKIFEIQLVFFKKYGFNRTIMMMVGFVELFGAITLWLPNFLSPVGALTLLATSLGAIACHLYFDTWKDAIPATITLLLSSFVFYIKLPILQSLFL